MYTNRSFALLGSAILCLLAPAFGSVGAVQGVEPSKKPSREDRFVNYFDGVRIIGKVTIEGQEETSEFEEYTITKCERLPEDDMYRFTMRIKQGDVETLLPRPLYLRVQWSGETPVISISKHKNPGFGSFRARVLVFEDRCAGTWQYEGMFGHLYGRFEPLPNAKKANDDE